MRRGWKTWALGLLVAAAFLWGVLGLFDRQFASGEFYPEFSTMRADRMGAKLLYDSLGRLPGISVEHNFLPLEFLPPDGATLVLTGVNPIQVNWSEGLFLSSVQRLASQGNRVVVAMHIDAESLPRVAEDFHRREEPKPPLQTKWKVSLKLDSDETKPHPLSFAQADGWKVRDKVGAQTLAIERDFGMGSVVLLAESADFTNESVVAMDRLEHVAGLLGSYRRIVFDERHLGVAESGSVVGMARKFRLMGLALGLGICAALFIWRNASSFPPPASSRSVERLSGRTSHAGLLTLLKRHIPPSELAAVCWREWLSANPHRATPEIRKQA